MKDNRLRVAGGIAAVALAGGVAWFNSGSGDEEAALERGSCLGTEQESLIVVDCDSDEAELRLVKSVGLQLNSITESSPPECPEGSELIAIQKGDDSVGTWRWCAEEL